MECLKDGYQMIKVPYVKKFVKVVGLGMRAVSEGRNVRSVSHSRIRMCRSQGQKAVGWLWPLWWDKDSSASGAISQWGKPFLPHDGQGRSKPLQSQCCLSPAFPKASWYLRCLHMSPRLLSISTCSHLLLQGLERQPLQLWLGIRTQWLAFPSQQNSDHHRGRAALCDISAWASA